jgi:phospholipid/cholesterol/gamma-HCH transport system substrate-binding protein
MASTATNHWKLGLFVLVGIAAIVGTLFWLGAQRFQRESFPAIAYFDESVQGLDVGSPVKFRGVTVGNVGNITIAPDHRHVQVTADIYVDAVRSLGVSVGDPDPELGQPFMPQNVRVQLVAAGITGVRFLGVDFFDPERYPPPPLPFEPPWNYLPSAPSTLRSLEQAAIEFANRLPALGEQTTATLAEGRATLEEGRITLVEGRSTLGSIRKLSDELRGADGSVNRLVTRLEAVAKTFETAVDDAQLAKTTLALRQASDSVYGAASGLGGDVGDVRDELRVSLMALRDTLDAIRIFVDTLNRDPAILVRGRRADGPVPLPSK